MKDKKQHINKKFSLEDIKSSGFQKPKNYLTSFEDDLFAKIAEDTLPTESGYKVPKGYFDTLEDTIVAKATNDKPVTKVISLSQRVRKIIPYAAAASVLLFVGLNYFSIGTDNITIDDLSEAEIENWLYAANDSNEITDVLQITDFEDTSITDNMNDVEIENYLDDIDTSTLLNEIN
ncbi:conserved protein of unknown function [Tenacibaculum sp. 190130A14a]|uniref:Uncharacterized protein n=1 Tax=Tenacibaculum polynesiense TaxID=3137857 RepID=A0ABP1F6X6_9FLAO